MTPSHIHTTINEVFQIERATKSREGYAPKGRAIFFHYCTKYIPGMIMADMGKMMCGRSHSTVYHSKRKLHETYLKNPTVKKMFEQVGSILSGSPQQTTDPKDFEIEVLKNRVDKLETEVQNLRKLQDSELKRIISLIPENRINELIENRLKPFARMAGAKC